MRIAIVWMPMVAGDDRAAALRAASELASERVGHFWDESRRIGRSASVQFVASRVADLRRAAREVPDLADRLDAWAADPEAAPAWDCAFFYAAETAWTEPLPEPLAWTKQLGFWESADGVESGGTFWTDRSPTTLEQSSWSMEIDLGMDRLLRQPAPHIEILGFSGCPHTATVLANVREAVRTLGVDARIAYVDQEALPRSDPRRCWPAPTILVDGRDLFGLAAPLGAGTSCRRYIGGAPSAGEIAAALRER